jgi:hypothetical protein
MLNRRDFLKLAVLSTSALAFRPFQAFALPDFSQADRLGRIAVGKMDVFDAPDGSGPPIGALYEDQVIPWLREIVGSMPGRTNQRFIETPNGYIWGGHVQPVWNKPNAPIASLSTTSQGPGMWVEVTVPYVDLVLDNPPARAPWLQYAASINLLARFYYAQVVWVDEIRADASGQIWYRLNEKYGSGDILWGQAEAFRPITSEELAPISPDAQDKKIVVRVWNKRSPAMKVIRRSILPEYPAELFMMHGAIVSMRGRHQLASHRCGGRLSPYLSAGVVRRQDGVCRLWDG